MRVFLFLALFSVGCSTPADRPCAGECDGGIGEDTSPPDSGPSDVGLADADATGGAEVGGAGCGADEVAATVNGIEGCYTLCSSGCASDTRCTQGICVPTVTYAALRVAYSTESSNECAADEPGPDIMWLRLDDPVGAVRGWGRVFDAEIPTAGNQHSDYSHLDGTEPDYDIASCPEFDGNVVSLGCETGFVLVEFIGAGGTSVAMQSGDRVTVAEYGAQCGGLPGEEFEVAFCAGRELASCGDSSFGGGGLVSREVP